MYGKNVFVMKIALLWCLLALTLVQSTRQKKDVHHMIILNENSRRPLKSHRHNLHDHRSEKGARKSRKKHISLKESQMFDDSSASESHEEFVDLKPKPKRHYHQPHYHPHHHKQNRRPSQTHKNPGNLRYQNQHKNYEHHHHANGMSIKQSSNFPVDNWIPVGSKELFGKELHLQHHEDSSASHPHYHQSGYSQPVPMEITTPMNFYSESTMFPRLSSSKIEFYKHFENHPASLMEIEPYKPFDFSVLGSKPSSVPSSEGYREQEVSSSNMVSVENNANENSFSIITENSRENSERKKENVSFNKDKNREQDKQKREKNKKSKRGRGRYRMRNKHQ